MPITFNGNGTVTGISVGGLPDGIVDTDMIANNAVTSAKSSGLGGLAMAEQWRVGTSSDITFNGSYYITANWEKQDQAAVGNIGSSMTESSGIFTFPSTGIYHIIYTVGWYEPFGNARRAVWSYIETTTDNASNWITATTVGSNSNGGTSGTTHANMRISTIFDVTNTSTHKCRFRVHSSNTVYLWPNTDNNITSVVFLKLGDT